MWPLLLLETRMPFLQTPGAWRRWLGCIALAGLPLLAADDIYWISGWAFLLLMAAVWLARKSVRAKVPAH